MASVGHLFRAPKKHLPMQEAEIVEALADVGFAGCAHARKGSKRQVLLVDQEKLDAMDLTPGMIRENITTVGLNINGLALEEHLLVGSVLLQVAAVCTPCNELEKVRPGLRRELYGRRGMLCRVVEGGSIRTGDAIQRVAANASREITLR